MESQTILIETDRCKHSTSDPDRGAMWGAMWMQDHCGHLRAHFGSKVHRFMKRATAASAQLPDSRCLPVAVLYSPDAFFLLVFDWLSFGDGLWVVVNKQASADMYLFGFGTVTLDCLMSNTHNSRAPGRVTALWGVRLSFPLQFARLYASVRTTAAAFLPTPLLQWW